MVKLGTRQDLTSENKRFRSKFIFRRRTLTKIPGVEHDFTDNTWSY